MEEVTHIILTIAKVREVMNKKMSVFCANAFMQKRNFKVRMYHISLFDVEVVSDVTNTEFRFYYLKQSYNDFPEDFYHCSLITLQ